MNPTKQELVQYYERSIPPEFKAETTDAVELYFRLHRLASYQDPDTRQGVVQAAVLLHEYRKKYTGEGQEIKAIARIELSPDNIIHSEEELKKIMPVIEEMRTSLFGSPGVPFKNFAKALEWLRDESRKEAKEYNKKNAAKLRELPKLRNDIWNLLDKWQEISEQKPSLSFDLVTLPVAVRRNGKYFADELITGPGTALYDFALKTKELEKTTCFTQPGLIYFTLAGIKPTATVYRIIRNSVIGTSGKTLKRQIKTVDIKIFRPLTDKEIYQFSRVIKNQWPRGKRLNEKHLLVYKFIDSRGGIPGEAKMIFWKTSWRAWNKKYPDQGFESLDGLRMAYNRIRKKLKPVSIAS